MTDINNILSLDEHKRAKTKNNMGYAHSIPSRASRAFYEHSKLTQGLFADIGAAYGFDSIKAAEYGANVLVIDKEPLHLEIFKRNLSPEIKSKIQTLNLTFPEEVNLKKNAFDGILLSRVLLFLNPPLLDLALNKVFSFLKPGGKAFIMSISPFTAGWEVIRDVYIEQKQQGQKWPGYITNIWDLLPKTKNTLPNAIQFLDEEHLQKGLKEAGFIIEESGYEPQYSSHSTKQVYAIAVKP